MRCTMLSSTISSDATAGGAPGGTMPQCDWGYKSCKSGTLDERTAGRSAAALGGGAAFPALLHRGPALGAQLLQRLHVALEDGLGLGKRRHGAVDAVLAQQVQRGIRRAVVRVGDVVGLG